MKDIAKLLANQGLVTSQGSYEMANNFFAQFGDDDTAFVAYHSAPAGFEAFSVMFGDSVPMRMVLKAENALHMEAGAEMVTRRQMDGRMVMYFTAPLYTKIGAVVIGGGEHQTDHTWLYFTMPEGGTVSLRKNGTPTAVTLEYSLDNGNTWSEWIETDNVRSLVLAVGQTIHVRNTSETSTGFSTSSSNYYHFDFTDDTFVGGNNNSLLCKTPSDASITQYCYYSLFKGCTNLMMDNTFMLPATTLVRYCYSNMFRDCTNLTMSDTFTLPATSLAYGCYYYMFYGCANLEIGDTFILPANTMSSYCYSNMFNGCVNVNVIKTNMTNISATGCLSSWLDNVSPTGDFYCPSELVIPAGANGIPGGWTRHDI